MAQDIIMPKLGLTMTHGKITRWHKKEGDPVLAGDVIVEIETDKINSEVESPADGYVLKILIAEGEDREITTPLCIIGEKNELQPVQSDKTVSAPVNPTGVRIFITPVAKILAKQHGLDYTKLRGTGPEGRIVKKDIEKLIAEGGYPAEDSSDAVSREIRISPVARKMAQENGIDFAKLEGTGPDGRIVKEDIQAAMEAAVASKSVENKVNVNIIPEAQAVKIPAEPAVQEVAGAQVVKKVPLEGIRKIIATRLAQSKRDIPHVYFKISVDAGNLMELKKKAAETVKVKTGLKLSLNDMIVKAVACAIEEFPDINVSLVGDEIIYYKNPNIGIAVDSEKGLVVPVVKNANKKNLSEMCGSLVDLIGRARTGKLGLDDMTGGTFTVSNLGAYHIDEFSAIINPPESAILAVGRAAEAPCVRDGEVVIRPVMNLTLSVDHRVIDGALAARFMKKLKDILEDPWLMLV